MALERFDEIAEFFAPRRLDDGARDRRARRRGRR